jgi:hypothetical protein
VFVTTLGGGVDVEPVDPVDAVKDLTAENVEPTVKSISLPVSDESDTNCTAPDMDASN